MKKILVLMAILIAVSLMGADRYMTSLATIGNTYGTNDHIIDTIVSSDTIAYASTSELTFTLDSGEAFYIAKMYKSYVVTVQIIYRGNVSNSATLTIGTASAGHELTAAKAISELDDDFWSEEVITLTAAASADDTEYYLVPDCLLNGKFIYFKYNYSADPTNDVKVAIFINKI